MHVLVNYPSFVLCANLINTLSSFSSMLKQYMELDRAKDGGLWTDTSAPLPGGGQFLMIFFGYGWFNYQPICVTRIQDCQMP